MRIQGGTHLGIVGCFGERTFKTNDIEKVKRILLEEFDKGELPLGVHPETDKSSDLEWIKTNTNGIVTWSLFKKNGNGRVIFEIAELGKDGHPKYKVKDLNPKERKDLVKTMMSCI
jgi:hypothetical protein